MAPLTLKLDWTNIQNNPTRYRSEHNLLWTTELNQAFRQFKYIICKVLILQAAEKTAIDINDLI
jgi:hypothetical protein